jgi:hypothetical protein
MFSTRLPRLLPQAVPYQRRLTDILSYEAKPRAAPGSAVMGISAHRRCAENSSRASSARYINTARSRRGATSGRLHLATLLSRRWRVSGHLSIATPARPE